MNITDKDEVITSFEPLDNEPFHYFALVKSGTGHWNISYAFPMTDKQKLINQLNDRVYYEQSGEARIMKVRLPIGQ
jgi:hypothetical protein